MATSEIDITLNDVSSPENLEVRIDYFGERVWINIKGVCVFRASRIKELIVNDDRPPSYKDKDLIIPDGVEVEIKYYFTSPSKKVGSVVTVHNPKKLRDVHHGLPSALKIVSGTLNLDDWRLMTKTEVSDYKEENSIL